MLGRGTFNGKSDQNASRALIKWRNVGLLALVEVLAMSLWFSASAVLPQLTVDWDLDGGQQSWMTMSVQIGFVIGAVLSAVLNLGDRIPATRLMAGTAFLGAVFNAAIPFLNDPQLTIWLRLGTGIALAGVYPIGMKLVATWCKTDRGLGIGLLVGGLVLGSALPHLLNAAPVLGEVGMPPWRPVLWVASVFAATGGLIAAIVIHPGPFLNQVAPFDWRFAGSTLRHKPTRLANFGYLGHMWELYSMWTWVPIFLIVSYEAADWSQGAARLAGFGVIAVGAVGSILAGTLADRVGRTPVTAASMVVSGACALLVGFVFSAPALLTVLCLIWGLAVVADSAQFSTAVSELTDVRYVGTALTLQTSLGFLLTMFSIRIVPALVDVVGWERVFMVLAPGPAFGIWSMLRLRRLPEAARMASGKR
jgi:MFS family permease